MPIRHTLAALLVVVIWGVNFVVIDAGLDGMPPLLFAAVRFVVVLVPAVFLVPAPRAPDGAVAWRALVAVGLLLSVGQFGLLYSAIAAGMPPGLASLVLQAQVMLTVLFAWVGLRERPTGRQLAGTALGVGGLALVAVGRSAATPLVGLLLTLAAATSWAAGNVASRRAAIGSGLSLTVWSALVVPVPLLALSLVLDGPAEVGAALTSISLATVLSTLYTAVLASLVGYGIWNSLLARHAAAKVVPFTLLVPVVGMLTAWLVQGEVPGPWEAAGGAVLLAGVAAVALTRRRPTPAPAPSPSPVTGGRRVRA